MAFWLGWTYMIGFMVHAIDTTPAGWKFCTTSADGVKTEHFSWLRLWVYMTSIVTLFWWSLVIYLVHESNPYDYTFPVSFFGIQIDVTSEPLVGYGMSLFVSLFMFLILHEPSYWYQVIAGFISSMFTGSISGGPPSMQNPLIILYTMANLDSTNWGTRATTDHGLYAGGSQDTSEFKKSLWWTKIKLMSFWTVFNVVVSFVSIYSYLIWGTNYGPEIYGYPWLYWPGFFAGAFIFLGRWLDWAVGRVILFHRERSRTMIKSDKLGMFLDCIVNTRLMSCEQPCHRNLEGTHCDTGVYKQEVRRTPSKWVWHGTPDASPRSSFTNFNEMQPIAPESYGATEVALQSSPRLGPSDLASMGYQSPL